MALTPTQREFYTYCGNHEFLTLKVLADFKQRLEEEGNPQTFAFALEDFLHAECRRSRWL